MKVDQVGETLKAIRTLTFDDRVVDLATITGEINATGFLYTYCRRSIGEHEDSDRGQFVTTSASMLF
ncbi:MAG: hypothetical protein OXE59_08105 [Bacteroidetes bacterium]|nr:hypothetical protein [Bacteroidota bacterium]